MLRVPKISSKPNEVFVSLSSTNFCISLVTPIQNDSILFTNGREEGTKLLGLYGVCSDKEATALFSVRLAPSLPPPSLQNLKNLLDSKFCFFLMIDFHVDVISKLCLWLSLFVFDWSTQHVGFSKDHGRSHWLSC